MLQVRPTENGSTGARHCTATPFDGDNLSLYGMLWQEMMAEIIPWNVPRIMPANETMPLSHFSGLPLRVGRGVV
jgi:hypothetical protein